MQNLLIFWRSFLDLVSDFLLSEPIIYFVGLVLLLMLVALLQRVFNISK